MRPRKVPTRRLAEATQFLSFPYQLMKLESTVHRFLQPIPNLFSGLRHSFNNMLAWFTPILTGFPVPS